MRINKGKVRKQPSRIRRLESGAEPRALIVRPFDPCLEAAANALRWVSTLDHGELMGDDAVAWWLLLEHGHHLPRARMESMKRQLDGLLPRIGLGRSLTYTATTLARTLARAGHLLDAERVTRAFLVPLKNIASQDFTSSAARPALVDVVWLLQAIYEIGNSLAMSIADVTGLINVVQRGDVWIRLMSLSFLSAALEQPKWRCCEKNLRSEVEIISTQLNEIDRSQWEISYLLLACLKLNMGRAARKTADFLIRAQVDGEWDQGSDENIEATALVALALEEFWKHYGQTVAHYEQQLGVLAVADRLNIKESLKEAWHLVLQALQSERGKALEVFVAKYCREDINFRIEHCNYRTESEELDLVLINEGQSEFFRQVQSSRVLVECKCRADRTAAADVRNFYTKLRNRSRVLYKVGLVISVAGFTKDAETEILRMNSRENDPLIGLVTGEEIAEAIREDIAFSTLFETALSVSSLR